jgi:uroporphyrinogen-III decarboxylase
MLAVIRGATPPGLLFVPRLDIWRNRNLARGTLPAGYERLGLREIAAKLGVGLHAVVPDFIRSAPVESIFHRGLGFFNNPDFPYVVDFSAVDFEARQSENEIQVVYRGRRGEITTRFHYGRELFESGSSLPDITEPAVKQRADYACLAEILGQVRIRPAPANFQAYRERVGPAGIAVAYLSLACSPMHHILRDLRKYEEFCLDLYDEPGALAECLEALAGLYDQLIASALASTAELVLFGANYDEVITYRPFFEEHFAPWLNKAADRLHAAGKFLLTHTDGENKDLLPAFRHCRFDVADSVCPAPMTKVSFREYREFFGVRATIWGGIPSNILLKSCCPEADFRRFVAKVIHDAKPYDHLILSIADTTPPDANFSRIVYLAEECAKTWRT